MYAPILGVTSQMKECRSVVGHGLHNQTAVEKEVAHFAACLGDQKTAVTYGSVRGAVAATAIGFVIGANRVVRTDQCPVESGFENACEAGSNRDKAA